MPDFCDASATNDNGSQGANFTAGGCELFANQSGQPASRFGKPRHFGILAIARRIHGQRDVPADHPELHALLISVRQVLIDRLAHRAEHGAAIRGECGEVLGHGGSCHVGDDTRSLEVRAYVFPHLVMPIGPCAAFGAPLIEMMCEVTVPQHLGHSKGPLFSHGPQRVTSDADGDVSLE